MPTVFLYSCKLLIYKRFLMVLFSQGNQGPSITLEKSPVRGLYISSERYLFTFCATRATSKGSCTNFEQWAEAVASCTIFEQQAGRR